MTKVLRCIGIVQSRSFEKGGVGWKQQTASSKVGLDFRDEDMPANHCEHVLFVCKYLEKGMHPKNTS